MRALALKADGQAQCQLRGQVVSGVKVSTMTEDVCTLPGGRSPQGMKTEQTTTALQSHIAVSDQASHAD